MGVFSTGGGKPPIDVVNLFTESNTHVAIGAKAQTEILSGALTATVYSTVLNITSGGGIIKSLSIRTKDATSRAISVRVTIDDTEVCDIDSDTFAASGEGIVVFGSYDDAMSGVHDDSGDVWRSSLKVEVKSSLTETDKIGLLITYNLT